MENKIIVNEKWKKNEHQKITIITPVFNRKKLLQRAIKSIENQTYRNFEYIIVNDGSKEDLDSIIINFMNNSDIPVMYIKKANGGVHTARNMGTKHARGEYWINLDSDDEFLPDTLKVFMNTWEKIDSMEKERYVEIRACCKDEKGNRVGSLYPDKGNMSSEKWNKLCRRMSFENVAMRKMFFMKQNLFPEPEGEIIVSENVLWKKLYKDYFTYYINDQLRILHTEYNEGVNDHLCNYSNNKRNIKDIKSAYWYASYLINNWNDYRYENGIRGYIEYIFRYCIYGHVLNKFLVDIKDYQLNGVISNIIKGIFWIPSLVPAKIYISKKM